MNMNLFLAISLSLTAGCTKSIDNSSDTGSDGTIACEDSVNGVTRTLIDSTSEEEWVYLDFERCEVVEVAEPESSATWDVGFRRFNPKINGGVSGAGEMEVAILDGANFDEVSSAPADGYVTDTADDDDDGVPEYAMEGWYIYHMEDHTLSPADLVYVIKTVEGGYVKLRFEDYYDDAGTSGYLQFSWAFIDEPGAGGSEGGGEAEGGEAEGGEAEGGEAEGGESGGGPNPDDDITCTPGTDLVTTTSDATDNLSVFTSNVSETWACFSFSEGAQVETGWDIAWKSYDTATSSTVDGLVLEGQDYDALSTVPEGDWSEGDPDLMDDWFDYSGSPDHLVTPKDHVYVLEDADGGVWKVQITTYYRDAELGGDAHYPTLRWASISGDE